MSKNSNLAIILNGIIKENPVFVLVLGMCPTLGTTTSALNGLGMGFATTFVLICSNMVVAGVKSFIPDKVRIPSFIVIIATFVTIVQMTMEAYLPALYASLGVFIPLIVVNCIILGRAEAFAAKNNVISSLFDGVGIGLGFTLALTTIGLTREFFGAGTMFGMPIFPAKFGALMIVLAPGAFIALSYLLLLFNRFAKK